MPQFSDNLRLGPVFTGTGPLGPDNSGPSPMTTGAGPLGRVFVYDIIPAAAAANNIALAQAVASPGNLTLTAGAGVTSVTRADGVTALQLDFPRAVTIDSTGADVTQTATVFGYDAYGQAMSEAIAFNGTTAVTGLKAFYQITRIAIDIALAGNAFVGTSVVMGLPFALPASDYLISASYNGSSVSATLVTADNSTATTTTNDVRGTIDATAANGTASLVVVYALSAAQCGPLATRTALLGVDQA